MMHQEDMQELDHFDKRLLPRNAHDALGHLHVRDTPPSLRELMLSPRRTVIRTVRCGGPPLRLFPL